MQEGYRGAHKPNIEWDRMEAFIEAKKAGNASEDTRRQPSPPSRMDRVAWSQLQFSDNNICDIYDVTACCLIKRDEKWWLMHGKQRRV